MIECTQEDCGREFDTEHGLSVHLSRTHGVKGESRAPASERHEAAALRAAERQPVEGDGDGPQPEADEDVDNTVIESSVSIDEGEREILLAAAFLYGYETNDELICAALTDYLDWAGSQQPVQAAIKLRRAALAAAS